MVKEITIPLSTAQEHFMAAGQRGLEAGKREEQLRILKLLKEKGMYDAILVIKSPEKKIGAL
jgi:hypothetical protein